MARTGIGSKSSTASAPDAAALAAREETRNQMLADGREVRPVAEHLYAQGRAHTEWPRHEAWAALLGVAPAERLGLERIPETQEYDT